MIRSLALVALSLLPALMTAPMHAQQRPAITGVAFARFYTSDAAGAQRFYGDTLGYERHEAKGEIIYPVNALQWVELVPKPAPQANVRMIAVGFTTRDAAGLAKYLQAHGVALEEPLHDGEFGVRDPEGNLVYFVQSGTSPLGKMPSAPANAPSRRIIHAGYIVQDAAKEDAFWRGLLGFHPYWSGGSGKVPGETDWAAMQVPEGSDWLEYMLHVGPESDLKQHGSADHISLGVPTMDAAMKMLAANHCSGPNCTAARMGRDGKIQVNLFDPDQTRAELMEFKPTGTNCCAPYTGKQPTEIEEK
jgi:catechol 2,3-dioxygenase-like lactoylglutathione lyase family enzyme